MFSLFMLALFLHRFLLSIVWLEQKKEKEIQWYSLSIEHAMVFFLDLLSSHSSANSRTDERRQKEQ